jgi:hypothetical protein
MYMNIFLKASIISSTVFILAACAGGGGGGSSAGGVTVTPFTSWTAIQPNTTVIAYGDASQVSYVDDPVTGLVGSISNPIQAQSTQVGFGPSLTLSYGSSLINSVTANSGAGTVLTFDKAAGDTIAPLPVGPFAGDVNVALKADRTAVGLFAEPCPSNPCGWNYQSYGVWISGIDATTGLGNGTAGSISVGSATPISGMPATGTATFIGTSGGLYVSPVGAAAFTIADMSASVNFGTRAVGFSTTTTNITNDFTSFTARNDLNMSGTLTYASGTNSFNGALSAAGVGSGLSGNAVGKFYGPTANEIGGSYLLRAGSGLESLIGGFGGKR